MILDCTDKKIFLKKYKNIIKPFLQLPYFHFSTEEFGQDLKDGEVESPFLHYHRLQTESAVFINYICDILTFIEMLPLKCKEICRWCHFSLFIKLTKMKISHLTYFYYEYISINFHFASNVLHFWEIKFIFQININNKIVIISYFIYLKKVRALFLQHITLQSVA